jgi:beta-aspartyl-peptidase (threonine type)
MIVHSGAGSGKFPRTDPRFRELKNALEEGLRETRRGSSVDGVTRAVEYMEESGVFNAGKGSCLTVDGRVQLDAAIMRGDSTKGAGVGVVTCTYHPVTLARWLMENTNHVLLAGEECRRYALAAGLKTFVLRPSKASLKRFGRLKAELSGAGKWNVPLWERLQEGNTVGAVAVDSDGVPSAAVSTGGMWLKLPGRVGDSAVLGAGLYADQSGAACATGRGEEIIKNALCWNACEHIRELGAPKAARSVISVITKRSGAETAGIVTIDLKGRVGYAYNTEAMGRAWYDHTKGRPIVRI